MFVLQTGCKKLLLFYVCRLLTGRFCIVNWKANHFSLYFCLQWGAYSIKCCKALLCHLLVIVKTSHAGNCRTREGEKLKFSRGSGFPGSEGRPTELAFHFPWAYGCTRRAFASLLLLELSHFPTALTYLCNENVVFLHNVACTSLSNVHSAHVYSILWKNSNKNFESLWLGCDKSNN